MGNKITAVTKTNSKVIINMDIAVEALNNTDISNLHHILNKLRMWDEKNYKRLKGGA